VSSTFEVFSITKYFQKVSYDTYTSVSNDENLSPAVVMYF
jgi:hypothetical protein